jgi:cell division protein FtsL
MQKNELASLSNIQGIAEQNGLSYNNDNIIVINN